MVLPNFHIVTDYEPGGQYSLYLSLPKPPTFHYTRILRCQTVTFHSLLHCRLHHLCHCRPDYFHHCRPHQRRNLHLQYSHATDFRWQQHMSKWEDSCTWEIYLSLYDGWLVHTTLFTECQKYQLSFLSITTSTKNQSLKPSSRLILFVAKSSRWGSRSLLSRLSVVSRGLSIVVTCLWLHEAYLSLSPDSGFMERIYLCHPSVDSCGLV